MSATAFFFFLSMLQLIHNNSADAINSGLIGTVTKKLVKIATLTYKIIC